MFQIPRERAKYFSGGRTFWWSWRLKGWMNTHLDLASLDAVRTGEATAEEAAHARDCTECSAALVDVERVAGRIASAEMTRVNVPPLVRQRILAEARRRPVGMRWMAAAAAVLVAVLGLWIVTRQDSRDPVPTVAGDVDLSGRLDIIDAYALALRLKSGEPVDADWDLNGDGRVDEDDVDEIGRRSVAVSRKDG